MVRLQPYVPRIILDPIKKTELVLEWLSRKTDRFPKNYFPFEEWLLRYRPKVVPGTPEFYREIATNCFYCRAEMTKGTIDHFLPVSKDGESVYRHIFVICCRECNASKSNQHPDVLISKLTRQSMMGLNIKTGFNNKKKVERVQKAVSQIFNDVLYGHPKVVYYIRLKNKIPRGFLRVA